LSQSLLTGSIFNYSQLTNDLFRKKLNGAIHAVVLNCLSF